MLNFESWLYDKHFFLLSIIGSIKRIAKIEVIWGTNTYHTVLDVNRARKNK